MIFSTLVLEDGIEVGKKRTSCFPPIGYVFTCEGNEYIIIRGRFVDPAPGEPIKRHVIDEAVLTVEKIDGAER